MWLGSVQSLCHYNTCHFHFPCIDPFFPFPLSLPTFFSSSLTPSSTFQLLGYFPLSSLSSVFLGYIISLPYFHVRFMFACLMFHTEFLLASVLASSRIWLFVLIPNLLPLCLSAHLFLNNSNFFLHSVSRCSLP